MNTEESARAAKCAAFMGWEKYYYRTTLPHADSWGTKMAVNSYIFAHTVADYNPAADTPQGREQAEELKQRLFDRDYSIVTVESGDKATVEILELEPLIHYRESLEKDGATDVEWPCVSKGEGSHYGEALANAVAKLEAERSE